MDGGLFCAFAQGGVGEVGVACGHRCVGVSERPLNLVERGSGFKQVGGVGVAQVVDAEVLDASGLQNALEGPMRLQHGGVRLLAGEDVGVVSAPAFPHAFDLRPGRFAEADAARLAGLGLGEHHALRIFVEILPAQVKDFTRSKTGQQ